MADAPKILGTDSLRKAYPKLNNAIDNSNEALTKAVDANTKSTNAVNTANQANAKSDDIQTQLNNIIIESGTSDAEVIQARGGAPVLNERLNGIDTDLVSAKADLDDRGVNLRTLGAAMDGVADDYQIVMDALATYKNVVVPGGATIGTTNTIVVGQGQSLIGLTDNSRGYGKTAKIKYIGAENRHKAVVRIGRNAVDAEPALDGTDIQFKNFIVDGNNLAGFGVYGTYLTNETAIENVVASYTLEYAMYFARSWYAKYTKLLALNNKAQGIALGMPLQYMDGTNVTWTTTSPLEMNNCIIEDIRANGNGKHYSEDFPNTFTPLDANKRRRGYGLGFGVGNSFNVNKYTTEKNGGVGLYVYTESQPIKTIVSGYIEDNCKNSGLDPAVEMAGIIIENASATGGNIYIKDVFMKYSSGGIYHTGVLGRKVWLKNAQQPRFLKSLDGLGILDVYAEVLKKDVYPDCGLYNTFENAATGIDVVQKVDTRSFAAITAKQAVGYKLVFVKGDGSVPYGSFTLNYDDGTTASRSYPSSLGTSYKLATVANGNLASITKSGSTGSEVREVTFKIVNTPYTYV